MTERPIIFYAASMRAIIAGTKMQFRSVMRPQPSIHHWNCLPDYEHIVKIMSCADGYHARSSHRHGDRYDWDGQWIHNRIGSPGDRLWCRETWTVVSSEPGCGCDCKTPLCPHEHVEYRADTGDKYPGHWPDDCGDDPQCWRWRSSSNMPRWASRVTLEVTGVRVQRVQDISEEDAKAEGMTCRSDLAWDESVGRDDPYAVAVSRGHRAAYREAWDYLNPKRPWKSNPWVWVISFKVVNP
jgi:hypothetical protein